MEKFHTAEPTLGIRTRQTPKRIMPTRQLELSLLAELSLHQPNAILAGVDEVGRGALAGPVSVGIALINIATTDEFPEKLRDSKQLSPSVREALMIPIRQWVLAGAVGSATAAEIDQHGIMAGLRIAAADAVNKLGTAGYQIDGVLLDGSHNWWVGRDLFAPETQLPDVPVRTVVKGDAQCAVIAAASVLAKVERDHYMEKISPKYPHYDWGRNKGYASVRHIAGLREFGPCEFHRTSWKLPGVAK
ncbi:ribonuclease HII [Arcanobacterium hippocoleae]|uniref:Ribonuclease n=1 Tax=Arcanobacterium hippocoleae TaxID=149017 RepID=A0ABU1T148_9ACTO|nr:ribonuclease HII [Arcanobacterium hippocoleae]MDR6939096.1 ribonuclease HII [Arcanobacterium hippocoleae]